MAFIIILWLRMHVTSYMSHNRRLGWIRPDRDLLKFVKHPTVSTNKKSRAYFTDKSLAFNDYTI